MTYNLKEYAKKYYPDKTVMTVYRMVKNGKIDKSHSVKMVSHTFLIETDCGIDYEPYIKAIREYHRLNKSKINLELSTKCGIQFGVTKIRLLNEILGL